MTLNKIIIMEITNGLITNGIKYVLEEIKPGMVACNECDAAKQCRDTVSNMCEVFNVPKYTHYLKRV